MKNNILYFIIVFFIACNSRVLPNKQIYQEKFSDQKYDLSFVSDTTFIHSLNLIQEIKKEINKVKTEGKKGSSPICYILAIQSDLGGHLEKSLVPISGLGFGKLDEKYKFYEDCNQLDVDKSLFYLSNLERDILVVYLKYKSSK